MALTVGSLFTGIGGFDEAFRRAGFDLAWGCEIEDFPRQVFARRFPGVPCYGDINAIAYGRAKNRQKHGLMPDKVTVLCGGFPCQDLSVAGLVALGYMQQHARTVWLPYFNCSVTEAGKAAMRAASPTPPTLTRGQRRYRQYLHADTGYSFGEWLRLQTRRGYVE